ncbi:aurora kinase A and ninein-interacting protein [Seriola dumerili]|nr:aurora kinase A and ninein-interacting protein [Seriola dumerili]
MKTSKTALQTSTQEECGVWLDTVQLKGKANQKRHTRPISKLLNPFADGRGYSLAVALNFTQTKIEMPKTKQSSISAFFTPQHRVLNKMSTSEVPNMDPALSFSASTSTAPAPIASGTKRRREASLEKSDSEPGVDCEWNSENVTEPEPEATVCQEKGEASYTPSQNMRYESEEEQSEEFNPPQCKKRCIDTSSLPGDSQPPPQAWSQDPLLTYSQYSDSESYLTNQKNTTTANFNDSEPSVPDSLQSEEAFGFQMDLKGRTSTQKSLKHFHSSQVGDDKENSSILYSRSPSKHSFFAHTELLSNHEWTEPKTASPQKHTANQLWKKADKEESYISQFRWTKPSSSPFKKRAPPQQQSREVDEDSLAMLFTQDSVGFRVIAHRGQRVRSPLKDQSNISTVVVTASAYKSYVEDEEDDMLFTQDSQGNVVIKH